MLNRATKMMIKSDFVYFDRWGNPTVRLSAKTHGQIEDYVLDLAVQGLFPSQSGQREWSRVDIENQIAINRYLWGRTVKEAAVAIIRDCRKMDEE